MKVFVDFFRDISCSLKRTFIVVLVTMLCVSVRSQNVTISPKTGNLIATKATASETGFDAGSFATWKHKQLPLTMTVADGETLTSDGQLKYHANNLYAPSSSVIMMAAGTDYNGYMTITLPKGYRFTGYKIVFSNNNTTFGTATNALSLVKTPAVLMETDKNFRYTSSSTLAYGSGTATLERTSMNDTDMGNVLYFRLSDVLSNNRTYYNNSYIFTKQTRGYMAITLESVELYFTTESDFSVAVRPLVDRSTKTSVEFSSYKTGKLDLGQIKQNPSSTAGQEARPSYVYTQVEDLTADMHLYEAGASVGGAEPTTSQGVKSISNVLGSDDRYWYSLDNGHTYFVEPPSETMASGGISSPLYYRITGATVHYEPKVSENNGTYLIKGANNKYLAPNASNNGLVYRTEPFEWRLDKYNDNVSSMNLEQC